MALDGPVVLLFFSPLANWKSCVADLLLLSGQSWPMLFHGNISKQHADFLEFPSSYGGRKWQMACKVEDDGRMVAVVLTFSVVQLYSLVGDLR